MEHCYERTTQFKSIEDRLDKVGLIMMVQSIKVGLLMQLHRIGAI